MAIGITGITMGAAWGPKSLSQVPRTEFPLGVTPCARNTQSSCWEGLPVPGIPEFPLGMTPCAQNSGIAVGKDSLCPEFPSGMSPCALNTQNSHQECLPVPGIPEFPSGVTHSGRSCAGSAPSRPRPPGTARSGSARSCPYGSPLDSGGKKGIIHHSQSSRSPP